MYFHSSPLIALHSETVFEYLLVNLYMKQPKQGVWKFVEYSLNSWQWSILKTKKLETIQTEASKSFLATSSQKCHTKQKIYLKSAKY